MADRYFLIGKYETTGENGHYSTAQKRAPLISADVIGAVEKDLKLPKEEDLRGERITLLGEIEVTDQ